MLEDLISGGEGHGNCAGFKFLTARSDGEGTVTNVLEAWDEMATRCQPGDTFFFYFDGDQTPTLTLAVASYLPTFYLASGHGAPGQIACKNSTLTKEMMTQKVLKMPEGVKVMISCHARLDPDSCEVANSPSLVTRS